MATKRPTRRAPTKPSPVRAAPPPAEDDPVPEPAVEEHPQFRMHPDGTVMWDIAGTTYILADLTAGAVRRLRRSLRRRSIANVERVRKLHALPETTDDEWVAKAAVIEDNNERYEQETLDWLTELFSEAGGLTFPADDAPGWALSMKLGGLLAHLEGPLPPGVR